MAAVGKVKTVEVFPFLRSVFPQSELSQLFTHLPQNHHTVNSVAVCSSIDEDSFLKSLKYSQTVWFGHKLNIIILSP